MYDYVGICRARAGMIADLFQLADAHIARTKGQVNGALYAKLAGFLTAGAALEFIL